MIAIDNAVELTIKTYLGLPKRVKGLQLGRKRYGEISESFPLMLDALEEHAEDRLNGVDLGEIEWYHRLRNELYHQGNGRTVERNKVEVYAQLANVLFKNFFDVELVQPESDSARQLGEFLYAWIEIERGLVSMAHDHSVTGSHGMSALQAARLLEGTDLETPEEIEDIDSLRVLRDGVIHGAMEHREALTNDVIARAKSLAARFREGE